MTFQKNHYNASCSNKELSTLQGISSLGSRVWEIRMKEKFMAKKFPGGKAVNKARSGVMSADKVRELQKLGHKPHEIVAHAESNGMRLSQATKKMLRV